MIIRGKTYVCGDHINTDLIIPGRYCHLPTEEMATHCMEDFDPAFFQTFERGGVIVAGVNFGCGSSREEAPVTLKAAGVACVVAAGFARIFFRNCINIGLPIVESPEAVCRICQGDLLEVDTAAGTVSVGSLVFKTAPFPPFMQELIARGGLVADARARLASTSGEDRA